MKITRSSPSRTRDQTATACFHSGVLFMPFSVVFTLAYRHLNQSHLEPNTQAAGQCPGRCPGGHGTPVHLTCRTRLDTTTTPCTAAAAAAAVSQYQCTMNNQSTNTLTHGCILGILDVGVPNQDPKCRLVFCDLRHSEPWCSAPSCFAETIPLHGIAECKWRSDPMWPHVPC